MKFKYIIGLYLALVLFASCNTFKKALAPTKSTYADTLSVGIFNRIHLGYDAMKQSPNRDFTSWRPFYDANIYDIGVLIAYDSTRKNNAAIIKLTKDWRDRLIKYEGEHNTKSPLNDGQIIIYQDGMDNAGKKVYLTEQNYK